VYQVELMLARCATSSRRRPGVRRRADGKPNAPGSTGWIGSAIVADLIGAGHKVLGLTRTEKGAAALKAAGAEAHRGSLADLDGLKAGAAQSDAVIHAAFNHDFLKFVENCAEDERAIEAMGAVLEGTDHPMLISSGVALLSPGRTATEDDMPPKPSRFPRKSEEAAAELAAGGVHASTVRLAPSVHGHGDHGFVPTLVVIAREKGMSAYIGDGQNRWPAVHRLDAARVYRLAIERGIETGHLHAVAEEGVPFREIAEVIGRRLRIPVVSKSPAEAADHFGWFAMFAGIDAPTSSARTRAQLDWTPEQPGLIADIDHPAYFAK
jgi:nucleoside-diphosphate-sugar epimerase